MRDPLEGLSESGSIRTGADIRHVVGASTVPAAPTEAVRDALDGTVEAIVSVFSELIGLWPDSFRGTAVRPKCGTCSALDDGISCGGIDRLSQMWRSSTTQSRQRLLWFGQRAASAAEAELTGPRQVRWRATR